MTKLHVHAARLTRHAAGAAFFVATLLFALPLVFGRYYGGRDIHFENVPSLCTTDRWLEAGVTWLMPWIGGGAPVFGWHAMQAAYPLRWPLLLFAPDTAATLSVALHLGIGAAATAWLARTFGLRPRQAALLGVAFVLTGVVTDLAVKSTYLMAAAYLPLAWAGARRALLRPRLALTPLIAVALAPAAALLGGEPQTAGICLALTGFEAAIALSRFRRPKLPAVATTLTAAVGGTLIGLLPWLPALAEMRLTNRAGALDPAQVLVWPYGPLEWLSTLWPGAATETGGGLALWNLLQPHANGKIGWAPDPFLGSVLLVALVAGLLERRVLSPKVVLVVGLTFSLGAATPVLPLLLELVPPLGSFRFPAKYLVVTTLAALVVAGVFLRRARRSRPRTRALGLGAAALAGVHLLGWAAVSRYGHHVDELATALSSVPATLPLSEVLASAATQALGPVLGVALLLAWRQERAMAWVLPLILFELGTAWLWRIPLTGPVAAPTPLAAVAAAHPPVAPGRLCLDDASRKEQPYFTRSENAVAFRLSGVRELQACDGFDGGVSYASPLRTVLDADLENGINQHHPGALRALGCDYALFITPDGRSASTTLPMLQELSVPVLYETQRLYRVADPVPPVFLARRPHLVEEGEVKPRLMRASSLAEVLAVVDDPLRAIRKEALPEDLPTGEGATLASHDRPSADRAVLHLEGEGGAVVGIRSSFLVGWQATQAGERLATVRVAGKHVAAVVLDVTEGPVVLAYAPPRLGLAITSALLGLLLVAGALIAARRQRRQPPGAGSSKVDPPR